MAAKKAGPQVSAVHVQRGVLELVNAALDGGRVTELAKKAKHLREQVKRLRRPVACRVNLAP